MKRKNLNVFSLSFLDIITCGLGAIILLFVLINAKSAAHQDALTSDYRAEVDRMERLVLEGKKHLIEARNSLEKTEPELVKMQGLSRRIIEILKKHKVELSDSNKNTLAAKAHVNQLKADLKSLEEDVKRLRAGAKASQELGSRLRPFPGQGDRQYLTDLKMGGQRIFILVDSSASMLDETIVGIIRRRNLRRKEKLKSPKWKQAVATIDWLTAQLPPASKFQVYTFNETAGPLIAGTDRNWLNAGDVAKLNQTVEQMHQLVPQKGTSLMNAFKAIKEMKPAPDNIFLLTDSLPTMGAKKPWGKRVSGKKRLSYFNDAVDSLPSRIPVNIILYPMEGDPAAAVSHGRRPRSRRCVLETGQEYQRIIFLPLQGLAVIRLRIWDFGFRIVVQRK
ncbi:MAG: VWA domain-containing protein [Deltaproteobacteria bacterium]|nr:VWA domain-containing protein [Deltaproteobacteria bacterium]